MTEPDGIAPNSLRGSITGSVTLPGDDDWDAERRPWNLSVDQHPAAVLRPVDAADVSAAVRSVAKAGLAIEVQAAGHGAGRPLDGAALLRLDALDTVSIAGDVVRVGGGALWGAVIAALDGRGVVPPVGSNPTVSVAGLLLNGGLSWFSRQMGFSGHAITAAEFVDGEGALVRVDADSDPELLWALRGAGAGIGVVTALEFRTRPIAALFGGRVVMRDDALATVLEPFGRLSESGALPDTAQVNVARRRLPSLPEVPEPLRGRTVVCLDFVTTDPDDGSRAIVDAIVDATAIISDSRRRLTLAALPAVNAEPTEPHAVWRSAATIDTLDEFLEPLVAAVAAGAGVEVRLLGGALAAGDWTGGIAGGTRRNFFVNSVGPGPVPPPGALEALAPHLLPVPVATFAERAHPYRSTYSREILERRAAVAARTDAEHRFASH